MTGQPWRLGASTLGAVEETLAQIAATMQRHAATAVELRTAPDAPVHTGLDEVQRQTVSATFGSAGIEILAVASRVRIAAPVPDATVVAELAEHVRLAADLRARFVRVFPGASTGPAERDQVPELTDPDADARAADRLAAVQDLCTQTGVRVLVETHDSHPRGEDVARLLRAVAALHPGHTVGAIWDVLHPWRVGEALTDTARHLLPHLLDGRGYVQIKDVRSRKDTTPVLQGRGAVPLAQMLQLLATAGYTDVVSLEWERHWQPQVEPLEEALAAAAAALGTDS